MRSGTITGPAFLASHLLAGEPLQSPEEERICARFLAMLPDGAQIMSADDDELFTWGFRVCGGNADGGTVCTYHYHYRYT